MQRESEFRFVARFVSIHHTSRSFVFFRRPTNESTSEMIPLTSSPAPPASVQTISFSSTCAVPRQRKKTPATMPATPDPEANTAKIRAITRRTIGFQMQRAIRPINAIEAITEMRKGITLVPTSIQQKDSIPTQMDATPARMTDSPLSDHTVPSNCWSMSSVNISSNLVPVRRPRVSPGGHMVRHWNQVPAWHPPVDQSAFGRWLGSRQHSPDSRAQCPKVLRFQPVELNTSRIFTTCELGRFSGTDESQQFAHTLSNGLFPGFGTADRLPGEYSVVAECPGVDTPSGGLDVAAFDRVC